MDDLETEESSGLVGVDDRNVVVTKFAYTTFGHERLSNTSWVVPRTDADQIAETLQTAVRSGRGDSVGDDYKPGDAYRRGLGRRSWKQIDRTCSQVVFVVYRDRIDWIPLRLAADGRGTEHVVDGIVRTDQGPQVDYLQALCAALRAATPPHEL